MEKQRKIGASDATFFPREEEEEETSVHMPGFLLKLKFSSYPLYFPKDGVK